MATERLSVLIDGNLKKEFEKLCEIERRSMSAQVVLLIEDAIRAAKASGRLASEPPTTDRK